MKSTIKLTKLALWPTLLVVSLALTACNNTTPVNEAEVDTTNNDTNEVVVADTTTQTTSDTADNNVEQTMTDELSRYRWTLATAIDSSNKPMTGLMAIKEQVTLNFNQQQGQSMLNYSVGCNIIGASYQLQEQTLSTKDSMSTKMSCGELDATENRLNELMQGDSNLSLEAGDIPKLTQVTSDATTLVWTGKLTAQAKYNSKGETLFWAISADTRPCSDNQAQMCLQVKPITYDEQGVKTLEGELVEFSGTIDGYEHDANQDVILRLQRFKTDVDTVLVDNIDSEYAYVLDTIIETGVAK